MDCESLSQPRTACWTETDQGRPRPASFLPRADDKTPRRASVTFVCPTEILAFNERLADFEKLGAEVLAVSTDSEYSHLAWANTNRNEGGLGPNLKLKLVADKSMKIARDYGVLLEDAGVALRGLFLIDPKGTLRQITINDLPVGRSVDETIRLIKAFQFVEEHGEVCPANWDEDKNAATIKPDPTASKEYFSSANK